MNWTEKGTLKWESMALDRCVTGMAYEVGLVLQGIHEWKDTGEASQLFRNWHSRVHAIRGQTGKLLDPMDRTARMIDEHLEAILAHWTLALTNAFMGGLNRLFLAAKRLSRGYRIVESMTAMLCFVTGKTDPTVLLNHEK